MRLAKIALATVVVSVLVATPFWAAAQDHEAESQPAPQTWSTKDWEEWGEQWAEFGEEWGRFGEEMGETWGARGEAWGEYWAEFGERFGEEFGEEFGAQFGEEWAEHWVDFADDVAWSVAQTDWEQFEVSLNESLRALETLDLQGIEAEIERSMEEMERSLERLDEALDRAFATQDDGGR